MSLGVPNSSNETKEDKETIRKAGLIIEQLLEKLTEQKQQIKNLDNELTLFFVILDRMSPDILVKFQEELTKEKEIYDEYEYEESDMSNLV